MRTIADTTGTLYLGKQGEHLARELAFPEPAAWAAEFGPGTAQLLVSPNGGKPYSVILPEEDGFAVWRITATDTARAGYGRCELRWSVNGMVVKSKTYVTLVAEGLSGECGYGGIAYELGHGLEIKDGKLTVVTTDDFKGDNTLPMTAAGVEIVVGNIEVLLGTI